MKNDEFKVKHIKSFTQFEYGDEEFNRSSFIIFIILTIF